MNILKNKNIKQTAHYSRYNGFPYYYNSHDKNYQLGTKSWLKTDIDDYITYTVRKDDTWDSLALEHYNNPTYYWVLCDFNRVIDPMVNPEEGSTIYIPKLGKDIEFEVY